MTHQTVWQAFEQHHPGQLRVSANEYETMTHMSLDEAKEWFPPKAPARLISGKNTTESAGMGRMSGWQQYVLVEHCMPNTLEVHRLMAVFKEAEKKFGVVLRPWAELGQQRHENVHPEMRIYLSPSEVLKPPGWLRRMIGHKPGKIPEHDAREVLSWISGKIGARHIKEKS